MVRGTGHTLGPSRAPRDFRRPFVEVKALVDRDALSSREPNSLAWVLSARMLHTLVRMSPPFFRLTGRWTVVPDEGYEPRPPALPTPPP